MDYEERRNMVHEWQRFYGMEPRADSRLTDLFASGCFDMPADMVARELMSTDFIYKHTLYGELSEEFLRLVADLVRREHGISWPATWNIVRFYGPIALKLICLQMSNAVIPPTLTSSQTWTSVPDATVPPPVWESPSPPHSADTPHTCSGEVVR